jgi:hypothetical protein
MSVTSPIDNLVENASENGEILCCVLGKVVGVPPQMEDASVACRLTQA